MGYPQLKESTDSQKIKRAVFAHCSRAADIAISDPHAKRFKDDGARQAAAQYSALLAVITDVGLEEEYRQYRESMKHRQSQ